MGTLIPQTKYDVLPPGTYRVRLGAVAVEDGIYGTQVVMRFDVLDEEFAGRCIKARAAAKLSGGRRPSKLYSWTAALLFGGMPLPHDYDLDTDALRNRQVIAVVEVIERDGVLYNRIAQDCRTTPRIPKSRQNPKASSTKSRPGEDAGSGVAVSDSGADPRDGEIRWGRAAVPHNCTPPRIRV